MDIGRESAGYHNVNEHMVVANLKRHLMSRNDKMKLDALHFLFPYLESSLSKEGGENQKASDRLIDADIVEYLGEAMATQDSNVLRNIFECLELFLNSEKFFTQARAAYVIECMQRTLYFLFKSPDTELSTANYGLRVLATFVEEFHKKLNLTQLFGSDANIRQIFELIASLLKKKEELGDEVIINASLVLFSIFCHNDFALMNCSFLGEMPDLIRKCLASLAVLCNSKYFQEMHLKIMALMVKIGAGTLGFCVELPLEKYSEDSYLFDNQNTLYENDTESESQTFNSQVKVKAKILSCVVSFLQNMWLPYIMKSELNEESSEIYFSVLKCIKHIYQAKMFDIVELSEELAKEGFTTFLPLSLNWATERQFHDFRILIRDVLIEYIACLSERHLMISIWHKNCDLKSYFEEGITLLPLRFSAWLNTIEENSSKSSKHFVIIFFYFFCLFLPSLPTRELHLQCLINYLTSITPTTCSIPVLKATWFLYTEAILCQATEYPEEMINRSTKHLLKLLESASISQLYTHHPAILFWSFSSPQISVKFQYEVMSLWLENEDVGRYDDELVKIAFANEEVIFCLLEILKNGKKELSYRAASVLGKAVIRQKEKGSEDILSLLWETLPIILAEYSSESSCMKGHNIACYMQVTCVGVPSTPSSKLLLQCGTRIMKILVFHEKTEKEEEYIESRGPAIHIALISLLKAMEIRDWRVLLSYTNQPEFLQLLYRTSGYPCVKLIRPSLHLLIQINKYYQEIPTESQEKGYSLYIDILHVLYLLIQEDYDILVSTLQLLYEVISYELPNPIMVIVTSEMDSISPYFLQILFRHLQNICSKHIPDVSRKSFKAMGAVLQYAYKYYPEDLFGKLATQPWTHTVLRILLRNKQPDLSYELFYFLCWWLQFYIIKTSVQSDMCLRNIRTRRKSRAPYPNLISETGERIASVLVHEDFKDPQRGTLAFTVLHRILLLDGQISPEITQAIRSKLIAAGFQVSAKVPPVF